MSFKEVAAKVAAATWAAVKPIAMKPHTWVVIISAIAVEVGRTVAPETMNDIAGIIVSIIGGL